MSDKSVKEKRMTVSVAKVSTNIIICLLISLGLIITSFFLLKDLKLTLADKTFWLQKILMGSLTFVLMICISTIVEELKGQKDADLNDKFEKLDAHYQLVLSKGESEDVELFLTNINKSYKYNAYISRLKKKLKYARKPETIERLNKKLLITPEELWESPERVKYHKVSFNQLTSGAFDVSANDDGIDLNVRKGKYGLQKFGWKLLTIVIFGGIVGDLIYEYIDFTKEMIVPLVFKIITILVAIYSGICFGFFIIERTRLITREKLTIFSKFRARADDTTLDKETRYDVVIAKDILVEKLKAQEASKTVETAKAEQTIEKPIKQTWNETFGSGVPVKAGGFVAKLIDNAICAKANK